MRHHIYTTFQIKIRVFQVLKEKLLICNSFVLFFCLIWVYSNPSNKNETPKINTDYWISYVFYKVTNKWVETTWACQVFPGKLHYQRIIFLYFKRLLHHLKKFKCRGPEPICFTRIFSCSRFSFPRNIEQKWKSDHLFFYGVLYVFQCIIW